MNIRNRILTFLTFSVLSSLCVSAQDFEDRVRNDKDIAAGVYHPYHHGDLRDTPAPKGYKAFYISHYGRHGSRYHASDGYFKSAKEGLQKGMEEGILTETGKRLYNDFFTLYNAHDGMLGELTPRGALEHRGIADRMHNRFNDVFKSKQRTDINCIASIIPRCIISMANFSSELKGLDPRLAFSFDTGARYFRYICKEIDSKELFDKCNHFEDSVRAATCHYDKLMNSIFTDPAKGAEAVKNPQKFIKSLFISGSICGDLDFLGIDLFDYFDTEELLEQALVRSDKFYGQFGNSAEWGAVSSAAAKDLVKDFVSKADNAVKDGSTTAADLRFGHDTGILPFYGLIGIEGMNVRYPMAEGHKHWTTYDDIPMATNFQMIFYKNKKGDILVKMLNNEEETMIPALETAYGPYYKWSDLRQYLLRLTE